MSNKSEKTIDKIMKDLDNSSWCFIRHKNSPTAREPDIDEITRVIIDLYDAVSELYIQNLKLKSHIEDIDQEDFYTDKNWREKYGD